MARDLLDRRVQFLRAALIDDGYQERLGDYKAHGSPVWASRRDASDAERFAAGTVKAQITTRFRVRSTSFTRDIGPTDRLRSEGVDFGIVGVKELGLRAGLEITAVTL